MRKRDQNIIREYASGRSVDDIATRRRMTRQRVYQILKPVKARIEALRQAKQLTA